MGYLESNHVWLLKPKARCQGCFQMSTTNLVHLTPLALSCPILCCGPRAIFHQTFNILSAWLPRLNVYSMDLLKQPQTYVLAAAIALII